MAPLIGCAIAAMAFGAAPAQAGCNSGDVANTDLLSSADCQADASGANATAVGSNSTAGVQGTAYGAGSDATGQNSTAAGVLSSATGFSASAFGITSTASGNSSSAYGASSTASGDFGAAFGSSSTASGNNSAAYGTNSTASGAAAVAIGFNASATHANSAAFGAGATTTRDNQQVFGTASSTYTMAGIASQASRDAQTGPIYLVTSDSDGNLATTSFDVTGLQGQIDALSGDIKKVGALSAALAGLHPNARSTGDNHLSGAVGTYDGQFAFAAGYFRNFGDDVLFSVGGAASDGDVSANAGFTLSW
jgi:autotransporter adhesin